MGLHVGQVWRTAGAYGWQRVERVQLPGHPDYDGGLPGVSVRDRAPSGRWTSRVWFVPAADEAAAVEAMRHGGYEREPL